jgi:ketosteroid isomerase-like protein
MSGRHMKNQSLVCGLVLLLCASLAAAADKRADTVAHLKQLSDHWDKVIVAKDATAIAANMAEDFRIIDRRGDIDNKSGFVAGVLDPKLTIDPYTVQDFEVRLYGHTALLSGRTHMTGMYAGQPFTSNYRYIDIYVRKGAEWQIVSVQITQLPEQKAP